MNIVADPNIPFIREAFGPLGAITLLPGRQIAAAAVRNADALLVRSVTPVNESLLAGSKVKFVATATIGTDHVDEQYLSAAGIGFASAAGSNANSVAEYLVAAILELAYRRKFRLRDKTIGVVGVGNVGSRVVRYAEALGMSVLQNDPPRERAECPSPVLRTPSPPAGGEGRGEGIRCSPFISLERVLAEADIVTLHVPLDSSTRYLLNHDNLERFLLINTSRGAVVDNRALLKAIDGDRIPGAVLDVWENEPNISPELLDVVDIGTPHIAGYSLDGKVNGTRMIYESFCQHFNITPSWQPQLPPVPALHTRSLPGEDDEDLLRRVIREAYDITRDDAALRKYVRQFDRLRAEYPVRREFFNSRIEIKDGNPKQLRAVGFAV